MLISIALLIQAVEIPFLGKRGMGRSAGEFETMIPPIRQDRYIH